MKFRVEWQEWVYDPQNDLQCIIDKEPLVVNADSVAEAIFKARDATHDQLTLERPDQSHGTYIPELICLVSENGTIFHLKQRSKLMDSVHGSTVVNVEE